MDMMLAYKQQELQMEEVTQPDKEVIFSLRKTENVYSGKKKSIRP